MEFMLIGASAVSFVIAAGMSLIAWKLLREQDQRSAARVALLEFASEEDDAYRQTVRERRAARPAGRRNSLDAFEPEFARGESDRKTVESDPWDLAIAPAVQADARPPRSAPAALFVPAIAAAPSRRGQVAAVMALMIAIGAGTVYALRDSETLARLGLARGSASQASESVPMELLSLRHSATDDGAFVVTGLVQNPASGPAVAGLAAVVYLFDKDGKFFATGRADVTETTLGPGEEAAFTVRVATTSDVTRYRVGFRRPDGGVVAHVDRRGAMPEGTTGDLLNAPPPSITVSPLPPQGNEN